MRQRNAHIKALYRSMETTELRYLRHALELDAANTKSEHTAAFCRLRLALIKEELERRRVERIAPRPTREPFENECARDDCRGELVGVSDDPTPRPPQPGAPLVCERCRYVFTFTPEGQPREFTLQEIALLRDSMRVRNSTARSQAIAGDLMAAILRARAANA